MITVARDNVYGRMLALIAAMGPAELADLADAFEPRPALVMPPGNPLSKAHAVACRSTVRLWRLRVAEWSKQAHVRRHDAAWRVKRLREHGLVERAMGPPIVAADVPTPITAKWLARRYAAVADVDVEADDYDPGAVAAPCEVALAIVARCRAGAASVREAVGTSGAEWEVYERLCRAEVLWRPSLVRPTEAGVRLVESWYAKEEP